MSEVKERPIIFSGAMVQAILDGQKIQTRRVIKSKARSLQAQGQKVVRERFGEMMYPEYKWSIRDRSGLWVDFSHEDFLAQCPYGKPGDRLWVRETFAIYQTVDYLRGLHGGCRSEISDGFAAYKADGHLDAKDLKEHIALMSEFPPEAVEVKNDKFLSPMFMPRWASRILLEIESVRVERVREISSKDALSEGVSSCPEGATPRARFASLWNSFYENTPKSWSANPYVWVIQFKVVGAE